MCPFSFALDDELTSSQWNQFRKACDNFFGVSTSTISASSYDFLIYDYRSSKDIRIWFFWGDTGVSITTEVGSTDAKITSNDGQTDFDFYKWNGSKWSLNTGSEVKSFTAKQGYFVLQDSIPVTQAECLYYTYSFLNDNLSEITSIQNDVNNLNTEVSTLSTTVNTLQTDVDNINSEIGGVGEKLDTIVDGQQTTNQNLNNINNNQQQTNTKLDSLVSGQITTNEQLEELNNTIKEEPSTTEDDFANAFPEIEVEDMTAELFENLSTGVFEALTDTAPQTISFSFRGVDYTISSDDINPSASGLTSFVGILVNFGLCIWLIKDIRHKIQQIQEGKIESIATEDISSNMV